MAIVYLRLVRLLPLPLFKVARFLLCMAPVTSLDAVLEYRRTANSSASLESSAPAGPRSAYRRVQDARRDLVRAADRTRPPSA